MEELVKGFMIHNTSRYMLEDGELRSRLDPALVARLERMSTDIEAAAWRPRRELTDLWHEIARATTPHDDKHVYDALVRCGEQTGHYSTNTFFRLLLKILTPRMFASRFSEFYKRDQQGGEGLVEEVGQNHVALMARDIKGYDHFGPITVGFASIPFRGMGLKNVRLSCSPWSLAEPGPTEVRFRVEWD